MTEQTQDITETLDTTPALTIDADGNAVNLSIRQGLTVWQAIGLLETATLLLKRQYGTVQAEVVPQEKNEG